MDELDPTHDVDDGVILSFSSSPYTALLFRLVILPFLKCQGPPGPLLLLQPHLSLCELILYYHYTVVV